MSENGRPRRGDRYEWHGVDIGITRVAADGTWADITVSPPSGAGWTKRQPLPFPSDFVAVDRG